MSQPNTFVTTTDTCSSCGAKLKNAEASRLQYQQRAFELGEEVEVWRQKFNAMAVAEQTSRVEANRLRGELKRQHATDK